MILIRLPRVSPLVSRSIFSLTAPRMTNRLCVLLDLDCYLCTLISSLAIDQYLLSYRLAPLPTYIGDPEHFEHDRSARQSQATTLLATGPGGMVRTSGGTVRHLWHYCRAYQVQLRRRFTLHRGSHGSPRPHLVSTRYRSLQSTEGTAHRLDSCF